MFDSLKLNLVNHLIWHIHSFKLERWSTFQSWNEIEKSQWCGREREWERKGVSQEVCLRPLVYVSTLLQRASSKCSVPLSCRYLHRGKHHPFPPDICPGSRLFKAYIHTLSEFDGWAWKGSTFLLSRPPQWKACFQTGSSKAAITVTSEMSALIGLQ